MEIITAFNLSARCGAAPDLVRIMFFMWDFRFINTPPVIRRNDVGWFRNPRRADRRDRTRRANDNMTSVRPPGFSFTSIDLNYHCFARWLQGQKPQKCPSS